MERHLKFRARAKHYDPMTMPECGWVEGFYYEDLCNGEMKSFIKNSEMTWEVEKDTVGQFTELKDKNGKEIYEGDIVRVQEYYNNAIKLFSQDEVIQLTYDDVKGEMDKEWIADVKYEESCFFVYDTFLSAFHGDMRFSFPMYEIDVIGNIYDNKGLLED